MHDCVHKALISKYGLCFHKNDKRELGSKLNLYSAMCYCLPQCNCYMLSVGVCCSADVILQLSFVNSCDLMISKNVPVVAVISLNEQTDQSLRDWLVDKANCALVCKCKVSKNVSVSSRENLGWSRSRYCLGLKARSLGLGP